MEQIKEFLSSPNFHEVMAYVLILVGYLWQFFIRKFVKKDSMQTLFRIDKKTESLDKVHLEMDGCVAELKAERRAYEAEKKRLEKEVVALRNELGDIRKAMRLGFSNVESLVKSGAANKISKLLSAPSEAEENTEVTE